MNGRSVEIILACTAIESIALFAGVILSVQAPLGRRLAALAASTISIYLLNIVRNGFVLMAYGWSWFGSDSFDIAHNIIAKAGSTGALLAISYLVFLLLPELLIDHRRAGSRDQDPQRRCSLKLAKNSTAWISVPIFLTAALAVAGSWYMSAVALAGFVFMIFFHRDPDRLPHGDGMVSPADGRIIQATPERITVFMGPSDVHVNRAPMDGTVRSIEYRKGTHLPAFLNQASQQSAEPDKDRDRWMEIWSCAR